MQKLNVIIKLIVAFSVLVTLKLCREYLNVVTRNTPVLLQTPSPTTSVP